MICRSSSVDEAICRIVCFGFKVSLDVYTIDLFLYCFLDLYSYICVCLIGVIVEYFIIYLYVVE